MLPYKNRLKKSDFDLLKNFKKKIFDSENFTLKLYKTGSSSSRFAVVVSSSVLKKATQRNMIKRQIKGVILRNLNFLQDGFAVVVYLKKEGAKTSFKTLEKNLLILFEQANILK